ncbi:MAG TPA: hypothetical protein VLN45_12575, partial [Ignavibacteriaceae bacterium]|nr:hypothetical protein [Ignavibacteriaceae bacterium]
VSQIEYSYEKSKIFNEVKEFVNEFSTRLDFQITSLKNDLLKSYYDEGEKFLAELKYDYAFAEFNKIFSISNDYRDTRQKIKYIEKMLIYTEAEEYLKEKKYFKAYWNFARLSFPDTFSNSLELFRSSFRIYCASIAEESRKSNNLKKYLSIFDSLFIYQFKDPVFVSNYYKEFRDDFIPFVIEYYYDDIKKYRIIPSGEFYQAGTGKKIFIKTFLASPNEISKLFYTSILIINSKEIKLITDVDGPKLLDKTKELLGLRLMTDEEIEYINCNGWRSEKERNMYSYNSPSYYKILDPDYCLCLDLEDIHNKTLMDEILSTAEKIKEEIELENEKDKEAAYTSKKIPEIKRLFIIPNFSSQFSSNDWVTGKFYSPSNELRLFQKRSDVQFGAFFGYVLDDEIDKGEQFFNGIGINIGYLNATHYKDSRELTLKGSLEADISNYSLGGYEIEFQYRPAVAGFSGILSLGYGNYKSSYNFSSDSLKFKSEEVIPSIISSIGFGMTFTNILVQFYMKSIFSLNSEGQFSFHKKNYSGNIIFGFSIGYSVKFLRYEPLVY